MLNREQILVLVSLLKSNTTALIKAKARDEILELIENDFQKGYKFRLTDRKLKTKISELYKLKYLEKGVKTSNFDTYYMTSLGLEELNKFKDKKEDK